MLSRSVYRIHGLACWILIALGVAHGLGTLVDVFAPTFFAPRDAAVLADMRATPVAVGVWFGAEGMTVWKGHLGWNFSVAFGFAFLGAVQILLRRSDPHLLAASCIVPLATVLSLLWTVIAATCWFWLPCLGFTVATVGFAVTWHALRGVERPPPAPHADARLLWIGAMGMGILGAVHGLGTFPDIFADALFSPSSPEVRHEMEKSDLLLPAMFGSSRSTWRAYLGFNLSHGLGVTGYALAAWLLARHVPGVVARNRPLQALFAAASTNWFVVALAFWFYAPVVATGLAMACHIALLVRQPKWFSQRQSPPLALVRCEESVRGEESGDRAIGERPPGGDAGRVAVP